MLQVFLVSVLIAAIVTVLAVNTLEDYTDERDQEYDDADSFRGAAIWLLFLSAAAIIYHGMAILLRVLYMNLTIKSYFSGYAFIVSINTHTHTHYTHTHTHTHTHYTPYMHTHTLHEC